MILNVSIVCKVQSLPILSHCKYMILREDPSVVLEKSRHVNGRRSAVECLEDWPALVTDDVGGSHCGKLEEAASHVLNPLHLTL